MKIITLLLAISFPALIWSQTNNHFNENDAKWNVARTKPAGNINNPNFIGTTTTVFGFHGDTTINGDQWFKMFSSPDSLFVQNLKFHGLIRAENQNVYFIDTLNQLDTLYDFNLAVGDSALFNINGMSPNWLKIVSIDSVEINSVYYKRQHFEEPIFSAFDILNEVWIEGIGSIHGPLFPNHPYKSSLEMPDSTWLTCSFSANQSVWQHPSISNCYVQHVLGIEEKNLSDFNFYPNPFTDKIIFESNQIQKLNVKVMNSMGLLIREFKIESAKQVIDLSELYTGIYFLEISSPVVSQTMKVIKD